MLNLNYPPRLTLTALRSLSLSLSLSFPIPFMVHTLLIYIYNWSHSVLKFRCLFQITKKVENKSNLIVWALGNTWDHDFCMGTQNRMSIEKWSFRIFDWHLLIKIILWYPPKVFPIYYLYREAMHLQRFTHTRTYARDDHYPICTKLHYGCQLVFVWPYYACT